MGCGVAVGLLGGVVELYDALGGPIVAGVAVGVASALAVRSRPLLLSVVASVAVVESVLATIVMPRWYSGRMPLGRMITDLRLLFGGAGLLLLVCVPAVLTAMLTTYIKRRAAEPAIATDRPREGICRPSAGRAAVRAMASR